jgi:ABC-type transport system involved in multi-copper enzyme maturation permease subunit
MAEALDARPGAQSWASRPRASRRLSTFLRGLNLGVRGLVAKELRARSRGWRPALLLTAYLGILALAVTGFLALVNRVGGTMPPNVGAQLFSTLMLVVVLLLAFITPSLTAGAVSGERERRTLDLLLVTRSSTLGLAAGKLAGSLVYVLFLLAASLPAFALVYLFGGVPPRYLVLALVVAITTAITHASIGLLLSSVFKRTALATALTYFVVIVLVFGISLASMVASIAAASQSPSAPPFATGTLSGRGTVVPMSSLQGSTIVYGNPPPGFVSASPLTALAFVMPSDSTSAGYYNGYSPYYVGVPLIGTMLRAGLGAGVSYAAPLRSGLGTHVTYVVGSDPTAGQVEIVETWAPWVSYLAIGALMTLVCLLGAALAMAPIKPWQAWRLRRRRRLPAEATP